MITTYGELKTAIANWLDDDNLTSRIPEFVSLCEDRIAQNIRIRLMETSADLTINAQEVSLPTGYLGHRRLYLLGNPVRILNYETPDNFWQSYMSTDTAKPVAFTVEGRQFRFRPRPRHFVHGQDSLLQAADGVLGRCGHKYAADHREGAVSVRLSH
jgi:hypothetical protein